MELAKGIILPVLADRVLSPVVYYGELTGIYFQTEDEQFGRITFHNLDAIKICRGENLPFLNNWEVGQDFPWVYKVDKSKWLKERFDYENENYGSSYEFGGNVNEMRTDFSHYVFKFHDQFVEVIARGFWFEKDTNNLFKKELKDGHPFLPLPETNVKTFEIEGIKYKAIFNPIATDNLIQNTQYCQQKLIEFGVDFEGKFSVSQTLIIMQRQGKLVSLLTQFIGRADLKKKVLPLLKTLSHLLTNTLRKLQNEEDKCVNKNSRQHSVCSYAAGVLTNELQQYYQLI
jgi:hypothetical protein